MPFIRARPGTCVGVTSAASSWPAGRRGELGTLSDPENAPDTLCALAAAGIFPLPVDDRGRAPDSYEN